MAERIRTTISLDPQVHAIFVKMAEAGGVSVSRCMGDWLADTADGAQFVAQKMQEARKAPKQVMREFQAFALGLHDTITEEIGRGGGQGDAAEPRTVPDTPNAFFDEVVRKAKGLPVPKAPPSSNTGGKSPKKGPPTSPKGRKS